MAETAAEGFDRSFLFLDPIRSDGRPETRLLREALRKAETEKTGKRHETHITLNVRRSLARSMGRVFPSDGMDGWGASRCDVHMGGGMGVLEKLT